MSSPAEVALHLDALRRYARVLARDGADADDLVQGALLRAVERLGQWRGEGDLRVWLMAILHNHFLDQMRARTASTARESAWAGMQPDTALPRAEDALRLAQVRRAFLALPDDQREALHLVALEGLSVAQAAEVLGVPPGTVMSRVGRARATLRRFEDGSARPALRVVGGRDGG
jgi:RNA polymerase sigma-70 factor (ECF subfamily)